MRGGPWVYRPGHPQADENGMVPKIIAGAPVRAASDLPRPMVISDYTELRSMADGRMYTSKAALRASYLPSGNPQGARYIEVGNEELKPPPPMKPDKKAIRESVRKAAARVGIPTC